MKYKLLKDKIKYISWHDIPNKDNVTECHGFCDFNVPQYYIDVLPEVVTEVVLSGRILFDDWDDEVIPIKEHEFFFYNDRQSHAFGRNGEITIKPHLVCINRLWLEPIEENETITTVI